MKLMPTTFRPVPTGTAAALASTVFLTQPAVAAAWLDQARDSGRELSVSTAEASLEETVGVNAWQTTGERERGEVSWYDRASTGGNPTASMEPLDDNALTAAHKTLPMGTMVRIRNLDNGRSVVVRINDRGPYIDGRVIDVTPAAADELDLIESGVADCVVEVLDAVD